MKFERQQAFGLRVDRMMMVVVAVTQFVTVLRNIDLYLKWHAGFASIKLTFVFILRQGLTQSSLTSNSLCSQN